jgi:hypothetical protein
VVRHIFGFKRRLNYYDGMTKRFIYLLCLLPGILGFGPCDSPNENAASTPDGGDSCGVEDCSDRLDVAVIRADNNPFEDGTYSFAGLYPSGAYVESSCLYDTVARYLDCENAGMAAVMDSSGRKVTLTFQGAPERLRVGVAYNQIKVGDVEVEPVYDNGDAANAPCPSACWTARETIAVEVL